MFIIIIIIIIIIAILVVTPVVPPFEKIRFIVAFPDKHRIHVP